MRLRSVALRLVSILVIALPVALTVFYYADGMKECRQFAPVGVLWLVAASAAGIVHLVLAPRMRSWVSAATAVGVAAAVAIGTTVLPLIGNSPYFAPLFTGGGFECARFAIDL